MATRIEPLKLSRSEQEKLLKQAYNEYRLAREKYSEDAKVWKRYLKEYLLQLRNFLEESTTGDGVDQHEQLIVDNLMFVIHQTILASLYENIPTVSFLPRTEGDYPKVSVLERVAEFDFYAMGMDRIEYNWLWDATFFGRTVLLLKTFDVKKLLPKPELVSPISFFVDPMAESINGDEWQRGQARFFGRIFMTTYNALIRDRGMKNWRDENEIYIKTPSEYESEEIDDYFNLLELHLGSKGDMQLEEKLELGYNQHFVLMEWYTHWKGKKIVFVTTPNFDRIFKAYVLDDKQKWCAIDRVFQPIPHKWDSVTIPLLTEDKQALRTAVINMILDIMNLQANRQTFIDTTRVKDLDQLYNPEAGGVVEVIGDPRTVAYPMDLPGIDWGSTGAILNLTDELAQRNTATPEIQQGVPSRRKRPATEIEKLALSVKTRYGLYVETLEWSSRDFWKRWYTLYKKFFTKADKKIIRVAGAPSYQWLTVKREDIIMQEDPDVKVTSKAMQALENQRKLANIISFIVPLAQADPNFNRRYLARKILEYSGFKADEIDYIVPPTSDEIVARLENEKLAKNEKVEVQPQQDHMAHILEHTKAPHTMEKVIHITKHLLFLGGVIPEEVRRRLTPTEVNQIEAQMKKVNIQPPQELSLPEETVPAQPEQPTQVVPQQPTATDIIQEDINSLLNPDENNQNIIGQE